MEKVVDEKLNARETITLTELEIIQAFREIGPYGKLEIAINQNGGKVSITKTQTDKVVVVRRS